MLPISTSCETGVSFQSKERPSRLRLFALLWPPICWRVLELVLVPKVPRWICWNHEFVHRAKGCKWPGRMQCPVHGLWLGRNGWAWKFRMMKIHEHPWNWSLLVLSNYHVECLFDQKYDHQILTATPCVQVMLKSRCAAGQSSLERLNSFTPQFGTPFSPLK